MLKEYRLTIFALLVLAVMIAYGLRGAAKQKIAEKERIEYVLPLQNASEQILYRKGYTVSYNKDNRIPNWVAWHLTADHTSGPYRRPGGAWHEDTQVPTPRITLTDFRDCAWTRGHMCPAGDNKWDADAMYETFLFTNCCPQHANLNSGVWNQIEMSCRRWAEKYGDIYIVCGPILFRQEHETIGPNKVVVPEAFFKVVLCRSDRPKAIGFLFRNDGKKVTLSSVVHTVDDIERLTGIDFFPALDDKTEDRIEAEANLREW